MKRLGLLGQIIVALVIVGLVPMAMLTLSLVGSSTEEMTTRLLQTHALAARTAAARVDDHLTAMNTLGSSIAANSELLDDPLSASSQRLLKGLLEGRSRLRAVLLLNAEGTVVTGARSRDSGGLIDRALALESPLGETDSLVSGGHLLLRLDLPLADELGWLRLISESTELESVVDTRELGEDAMIVLADLEGNLLLGSVGSPDLGGFPPQLLARVASSVDGASIMPLASGDEVLTAYRRIDGASWFIASMQPIEIAKAGERRLILRSATSLGAASLLALAVVVLAYSSLVRPLSSLLAAQRRLAGIGESEGGGSLVGDLQLAFETLEKRVLSRDAVDEVYLGRYRVEKILGQGAMGTVFRCWDPKLERTVALKTIRFSVARNEEQRTKLRASLLNEAKTIARFSHPNIVAIYDIEDQGDVVFLIMELVEGISLEDQVENVAPLSPRDTLKVALGMARALEAAHDHGIVHHDIKPANALLSEDFHAKILDFGISEALSETATEETVFGTPGFLSPELLEGKPFDQRCDLFALGATLYEALSGRRAFNGRDVNDILLATLENDVRPLKTMVPEAPAGLISIIEDLMHPRPARRPQSARELIDRLEALEGVESQRQPIAMERRPEEIANVHYSSQLLSTAGLRRRGLGERDGDSANS